MSLELGLAHLNQAIEKIGKTLLPVLDPSIVSTKWKRAKETYD